MTFSYTNRPYQFYKILTLSICIHGQLQSIVDSCLSSSTLELFRLKNAFKHYAKLVLAKLSNVNKINSDDTATIMMSYRHNKYYDYCILIVV